MFCTNCGTPLPEGSRFCPGCGSKVEGGTGATRMEPKSSLLVEAKCTNCGAALKVDPKAEAAICEYCKMPYIVQKAIQNFQVTQIHIDTQVIQQGPDPGNLIRLARTALDAGRYDEAVSFADQALSARSDDVNAWIIKILAAGYDIEGDRSSEIASYVSNLLTHNSQDEDEAKAYEAVLEVASIHLRHATKLLMEGRESIHRQLKNRRDKRDIAAMDSGYVARTMEVANEAIEYRNLVPDEAVRRTQSLQKKVQEVAASYQSYYDALEERYHLYNQTVSAKLLARKSDTLKRILAGSQAPSGEGRKGLFGRLFG